MLLKAPALTTSYCTSKTLGKVTLLYNYRMSKIDEDLKQIFFSAVAKMLLHKMSEIEKRKCNSFCATL